MSINRTPSKRARTDEDSESCSAIKIHKFPENATISELTLKELLSCMHEMIDSTLNNIMDQKLANLESKLPTKADLEEVMNKCTATKNECAEMRNEILDLKSREKVMERKLESLEKQLKENNLIFHGVKLLENEEINMCIERICKEVLKMPDVKVKSVHPINAAKTSAVATFTSNEAARDILRNGKLLKNTGISIHSDLPNTMRKRKAAIHEVKKIINHKYPELKMQIRDDVLIINKVLFTWDLEVNRLMSDEQDGVEILKTKLNCELQGSFDKVKTKFD